MATPLASRIITFHLHVYFPSTPNSISVSLHHYRDKGRYVAPRIGNRPSARPDSVMSVRIVAPAIETWASSSAEFTPNRNGDASGRSALIPSAAAGEGQPVDRYALWLTEAPGAMRHPGAKPVEIPRGVLSGRLIGGSLPATGESSSQHESSAGRLGVRRRIVVFRRRAWPSMQLGCR
ncbi:hypothetical protein GQ53DRAFT_462880 [Thozetella sp. PMI_491]|nr:hypothetical protein GQ53DRAFT_462880 [Thozetella sp. PMI_491]